MNTTLTPQKREILGYQNMHFKIGRSEDSKRYDQCCKNSGKIITKHSLPHCLNLRFQMLPY
jgi:hypothetical protein